MQMNWQESGVGKSCTLEGHAFWKFPIGGFGFALFACAPNAEPYFVGRTGSEGDADELARLTRQMHDYEDATERIGNEMEALIIDDDDEADNSPNGSLPHRESNYEGVSV